MCLSFAKRQVTDFSAAVNIEKKATRWGINKNMTRRNALNY